MNSFEKLLVFATILLPFTLLRFGFVGLGEIIIVLLFVREIPHINFRKKDNFIFSKFWLLFIIISFIGFLFNVIILGHKTGTYEAMIFDLFAYIMVLISCITIENHFFSGKINLYLILKNIFLYSGFVYSILYFLSLFVDSILGFQIRYFGYFSPLSNNIHQTAMFMSSLPFIGSFIYTKEKSKILKILILIFIMLFINMIIESGSFKALLGIGVGGLFIIYNTLTKFIINKLVILLNFTLIISVFLVILFNFETIYTVLEQIFTEEDIDGGRSILYSTALDLISSSPIVGLGTGAHIFLPGEGFTDSHQTFLTVILQGGLLSLFLFVVFIFKIIYTTSNNKFLFAALIPILIYAIGGDILRRLPVWIILIIFYYYSKKLKKLKSITW